MGKIKSKLIKRTARTLRGKDLDFSENFDKNKKILGSTMPSKKLRNQIAGYLSRLKRFEKEERAKLSV